MTTTKRHHSAEFKVQVVLALLKENETLAQICSKNGIHPTQARRWRDQALESLKAGFGQGPVSQQLEEKDRQIEELYKRIGQLNVESEWLKKRQASQSVSDRLKLVESAHPSLSLARQCALLQVNRSWYYTWRNQPHGMVNLEDVWTMHLIDQIYNDTPFYGVRKITRELWNQYRELVNHKRVARLMRVMGIQSVAPGPHTSTPHSDHPTYPYLLKGITASYPNHIWGVDITYIRCGTTWLYLYAVLDWHSRFIIAWELSDTLCVGFCLEALSKALSQAIPNIHNSDQGSHFTGTQYLGLLLAHPEIKISMDGRGRCMDNIFTERLWRTVKCEEVYLKDYQSPKEARNSLTNYLQFGLNPKSYTL